MKFLSTQTFQCGITVQGSTTLAGTTYLTGITNTASWDYVVVGTSAQGQLFTRTYAQLMSDISSGITLSLDGLSDVVAPTPLTGQLLRYNGVQWANWTPTYYSLPAGGTTLQYIDGTGALQTFPINLPTSSVKHQVKAGVAINKGQAVYVTSADGTNMIVGLASNASEATSSKTMGLLDATVSTNGFANVVTEGLLAGLDTSTAGAAGDPVWLGTGGNLIYGLINKPYAPAHLVFIGIVTRKNNSNGEIFVKVQNGFELDELHDVDLKTNLPVNGELLGFNGTLWVNKTIAGWLGYTPANASGTTNYISKFTGSTTLGNSQIFDDGSNVGIGTTSPSSRLQVAGLAIITNSLGSSYNENLRLPESGGGYASIVMGGAVATSGTGATVWGLIKHPSANGHRFSIRNNNTDHFNIFTNGNVAINTTTDSGYKLDVNGTARFTGIVRYNNTSSNYLNIDGSSSGTNHCVISNRFNQIQIVTNTGAGDPHISLLPATGGNVGIGTTTPSQKLDVVGNTKLRGATYFGAISQPSPPTLTTNSTTGGTLAAATYYYRIVAVDFFNNTTTPSNELAVTTTGSTSSVTISWPLVEGAYNYRIYRGTTSGGQNTYYTVGGTNATSFTDTGAAGTAGTTPTENLTSYGYFNTNGSFRSGNILIVNNGVGNISSINFDKSTDGPAINVVEYQNDATLFEFALADNPDGSSDVFHWVMPDWQNPSSGWKPLKFSNFTTQIVGQTSNFWSSFSLPSSTPYYTTNDSRLSHAGIRFDPYTSTSYNLVRDAGTGTGNLNVDVTGFTGTNNTIYWITIESPTTFKWGTGSYGSTPVATGVTITGGWQLLSNGVQIRLTGTFVAADRWAFRAFPVPKMGIGTTTPIAPLQVSTTIAATSGTARGVYFNPTVVATANSDTLVGLEITPSFTPGAFTGLTQMAARFNSRVHISNNNFLSIGANTVSADTNYGNGYITSFNQSFSINGSGATPYFRLFHTTGNLVLQNGGTFTDAGYRLDVQGNTRVNGGNTTSDIPFIINNRFQFRGDGVLSYGASSAHGGLNWDASGAYFYGLSGYGVGIGANGVLNHLFINTSGNVGIGTTSPQYKLDVNGSFNALTSGVYLTYNSGIIYHGSSYYQFPSGSYYLLYGRTGMGLIFGSNNAEVGRFDLSGNLGIGTTAPVAKLEISSVASNVASILASDTYARASFGPQGSSGDAHFGASGNGAPTIGSQDYGFYAAHNAFRSSTGAWRHTRNNTVPAVRLLGSGGVSSGNQGFSFDYSANVGTADIAWTNLMQILPSGNVGIGTITPTTKLHVVGTVTATAIQLNTGSGDYYINGSSNTLRIGSLTSSNKIQLELFHAVNPVSLGISYNGGEALPYIESVHTSYDVNTHLLFKPGGTESWRIGSHGSNHIYGSAFAIKPASNNYDFYLANSSGTALFYSDTSTGNIGIGTASPTTILDIQPSSGTPVFRIARTGGADVRIGASVTATGGLIGTYTASPFSIYTNSSAKVTITSDGSVGIGTTSPNSSARLHLSGATTSPSLNTTNPANITAIFSNSDPSYGTMFATDPTGKGLIQQRRTDSATYYDLLLQPYGGNIGIGIASPIAKLDVLGTVRSELGSDGNFIILQATGQRVHYIKRSAQILQFTSDGANTYDVRFDSSNASVYILSGNVGIGTTSPSQSLHVAGNIRVTGAFYDSNNQAGTSGQILKSTGSGTDWVSLSEITGVDGSGTANYVTKWSDADTITNSLIYDNGTNVGIGTTSPGYNFDVNGQVRVQDKLRVGTVNSGNGVVHMSSSATINPSATTIVWAQNVSVGMCAFIEYYILNNNSLTDQRAGTIMVTWNQSGTPTIAHTETTTPDIGSTIAVNFTSSLVGSDARINAVNSSANPYTIVMSYKYF